MKNIVAYCRTATELQDYSSIKRQAKLIRRYARNRGIRIQKIYSDPAQSGVSLNRPGLKRLLSECRTGNIGTIIVRDPDRLARDWVLLVSILAKLEKYGVRVEFSTEHGRINFRFQKLLWEPSKSITV